MKLARKIRFWLEGLFFRGRFNAEMNAEMQHHLDLRIEKNIAAGMTQEEAAYAARRAFGGTDQVKERCRDDHGFAWLDLIKNDVRFSVRSLCRARAFTLTVLLTLFLGISVTTLVYDLTQWIIFRASPFPNPQELFYVGTVDRNKDMQFGQAGFYLQAYEQQLNVFTEFAAIEGIVTVNVIGGQPIQEEVANVWRDTFHTLGIQPAMGRGFLPEEFKAGNNDVVVISDLVWRKCFGASPDVLGRTITINSEICVVVGVLARDQQIPTDFEADIYRPLVYKLSPNSDDVWAPGLVIIGRLKPGISREQAQAAISTVKIPKTLPQWFVAYMAEQKPLLTNITGRNRPDVWWVMLGAAVFLYAISCLNATNLMLIRLLDRRRELRIRFAIGGSRWQVMQIVAIEGLLLSVVAFIAVLVVVQWGFPPILEILNGNDNGNYSGYLDAHIVAWAAGLTAFSWALAMIASAGRILRADINSGLKEGGASMGETRTAGRVRNLFVVLQAAFAVILLTGTGLMVRSFEQLGKVDLGFNPVGKFTLRVNPSSADHLKPEQRIALFQRLQQRLSKLPGVKEVSYGQASLLVGHFWGVGQLKMADGTYRLTAGNFVSENFKETAGLTMKEGRWLSEKPIGSVAYQPGSSGWAPEAVINETLARERFGKQDPVGQYVQLQVSGDAKYPVVGVVKDVRDDLRAQTGMRIYMGAWVYPPNVDTLVLRLDKDPGGEFSGLVRRAVFEVDSNLVTSDVKSMNQQVTDTMATEHYAYNILRGMAAIALTLTVVGVFSVLTFTVNSRMTEFGVRMALGATPSDLNWLVLRRGVVAAASGVTIGIIGALALTRFMASMLYQTSPNDPRVYGTVSVILIIASIVACWLPARRAAKVDVARLLKSD